MRASPRRAKAGTWDAQRDAVIAYYRTPDARFFYHLFGGVKHLGYYPPGQEHISIRAAQERMTDLVGDLLDLPRGSMVLEAGCGEGPNAIRLARTRGLRVVGVDILDWNIRRAARAAARQQVQDTTEFRVMSYMELGFEAETFDGVYTVEALVHAPDPHQALTELHRVLKPGGRLVLLEYLVAPPAQLTPEQRRIATSVAQGSAMHGVLRFTYDAFPRLLSDAGFIDVRLENLTPRIMPMLARMYRRIWLPYQLLKLLHLHWWVVTAASVEELYPHMLQADMARYVVAVAHKPA